MALPLEDRGAAEGLQSAPNNQRAERALRGVMRRYAALGFTTLTDMSLGVPLPHAAALNIAVHERAAAAPVFV